MQHSDAHSTRTLVFCALLAALVFVITWSLRVPVPASAGGGYVNIGDSIIAAAGLLLGPVPAAIAAALGSGLADAAAGASVYILPTIIIKGMMGACIALFARGKKFWLFALGVMLAEIVMVGGYGAFEYFTFDAKYAFGALPFNLMQAGVNAVLALLLYLPLRRLQERLLAPETL